MDQKLILQNKRTRETRELSLREFEKEFSNSINIAWDSYKKIQTQKKLYLLPIKGDNIINRTDFDHDLQWNFNNLSNSVWYIKQISI